MFPAWRRHPAALDTAFFLLGGESSETKNGVFAMRFETAAPSRIRLR